MNPSMGLGGDILSPTLHTGRVSGQAFRLR